MTFKMNRLTILLMLGLGLSLAMIGMSEQPQPDTAQAAPPLSAGSPARPPYPANPFPDISAPPAPAQRPALAAQTGNGSWINYTYDKDIQALAVEGGFLWAGTYYGGVVRCSPAPLTGLPIPQRVQLHLRLEQLLGGRIHFRQAAGDAGAWHSDS